LPSYILISISFLAWLWKNRDLRSRYGGFPLTNYTTLSVHYSIPLSASPMPSNLPLCSPKILLAHKKYVKLVRKIFLNVFSVIVFLGFGGVGV